MGDNYIGQIKAKLINNGDIRYRDINTSKGCIHVVYCKTMCDRFFISNYITKPLLENKVKCISAQSIKDNVITSCVIEDIRSLDQALEEIISGSAVIVLGNTNQAFFCEAKGFNTRQSEIPPTEATLKGPREGFTENLDDSVAHIRRRIKNTSLKLEYISLGTKSKTNIVIVYIENISPQKLVNFVKKKN